MADADPVGAEDRAVAPRRPDRNTSPLRATVSAYLALTKPRIIELLLITTVPALFAAQRAVPPLWTVLATLVGGALAAGSANALNCVVDADIDAVMRRTRTRPLARHAVPTRSALVFGVVLGLLSALFLWATTTWQAAVLAVVAILFYVFVYSLWLKRRTRQNIVWGGLAGCMPVVIGWSAVTGDIGWPAWAFFGVIFFWTPPHTWALAMRYREDYAAAGVPMLPVVATERVVVRQIVLYSWAMVACSLVLVPASSWLYAAVAAPAGLAFLACAHVLHVRVLRGRPAQPMTLFHLSNLYLTVVSVAWAVDAAIGLPVIGLRG
ncbi:heme o synthase [Nakamurella endophytica]|uniref:Protoheme IX farnesyltransferase n=1 Tax=Nakamurella endophytica TaxID=1748367 RepID=A0A917STD1_9ACTN|nr:heme o synthase [Nakamurella endophytica]GGL93983.1 protoheme IX farnesyltransferase [Nakamurella endophytica]